MSRVPSLRASRRKQRGSALVEGALVFLVFFMLLLGMVEYSRVVWSYSLIAHGAREATRYAMVHGAASGNPATSDQLTKIVLKTSPGVIAKNLNVDVVFVPDNTPGSSVKVLVKYDVQTFVPLQPLSLIRLRSTSQRVILQ